jgi:hypothetical protein
MPGTKRGSGHAGEAPHGPGLRGPGGGWGGRPEPLRPVRQGAAAGQVAARRRRRNIGAATAASGLVVVIVAFVLVVACALVSVPGGTGDAQPALAAGRCQRPANPIAAVDGAAVSALAAVPGRSRAAAR